MSLPEKEPVPAPPTQERSRQTLAAIVRGTVGVLREKDFDDLTMADVAREAGVSVGTIYTRFSDKEALINFVISEILRDQVGPFRALFDSDRWTGVDLAMRMYHMVRALVFFADDQGGLQRAIGARQVRRKGMLIDMDRKHRLQVREGAVEWLLECRDEVRLSDPEEGVAVAIEAVFSRIQHWNLMPLDPDRPDATAFADELTRMALAYLATPIELPEPPPIATPYRPPSDSAPNGGADEFQK
jgi:AcrR family transcriptional regulator